MKDKRETGNQKIYKVSEFIDFLNRLLLPNRVIVQGEIGGKISKYPRFTFFDLLDKDTKAILPCFIWQNKLNKLGINLEEGMEVKVFGYPEIRKDNGQFKFQAEQIGLVGEGILKKQFEILRKKLDKEGVFSVEAKKPIPRFCQTIGLITSKYGRGAKKDFETHLESYGFKVHFYDVRVEGFSAIEEICRAIKWFNENLLNCDVLVLTRGGGSWESLSSFNSEEVARVIFASKIPVMVGVGHEDDETIADLAADFRASTPTHAARVLSDNWKLASVNIYDIERSVVSIIIRAFKNDRERIIFFERNLIKQIKNNIRIRKENLASLINNLLTNFKKEIIFKGERFNNLVMSLNLNFQKYFLKFQVLKKEFNNNISKFKNMVKDKNTILIRQLNGLIKNQSRWVSEIEKLLNQQEEKLIPSSPTLKLRQGYTITLDNLGKTIRKLDKLKIGQIIKTKFYKGHSLSEIKKIEK